MVNDATTPSSACQVIDAAAVKRFTPMPALIAALRRAFNSDCVAPTRHIHETSADTALLLMPAWRSGGDIGVKIATICTDRSPSVRGTYLLMDGPTGRPKAMLDGPMLTARRTAAASGLAASFLARRDARVLLIIGTGTLVPHLIEAHASVRPIDRVLIWGRDAMRAVAAANAARTAGYDAYPVRDVTAALCSADLVCAATLATRPVIEGRALRAGTHVDLVGAFRPDMAEADPECFRRARVFVDTREGALGEAGDLIQAIAAGMFASSAIEAELADLCVGRHHGRGDDREAITLFKSVGTSLEDLAAAELIVGERNKGND